MPHRRSEMSLHGLDALSPLAAEACWAVILRRRPQEQRSRPRSAYGARRHFPMDLDEFDEAVDAVVGEGHDAFIAEAQDPDEAVLGLHFDGDVEQVVDVLSPRSLATRSMVLTRETLLTCIGS